MSLQVNLSSPAIRTAYEKVLDGVIDYVVLSYKKLSNDLDVTAAAKGSLDDLVEEFSDGKVQYALARVSDPNTHLPKFVLINWCGEGVPENRKGLFPPHSATVADYFKVYHVSIQARTEDDILPDAILRKVMDSSGSKYGTASSRAPEPIAPVGTTHKPVGTPDIRGMQAKAPKSHETPGPVGTNYTPAREELKQLREGKLSNPAPPSAPKPAVPQPAVPQRSAPQPSSAPKPAPEPAPPKPAEEDKIQPVGTSYTPVSLPKPGKLSLDRTMPFSQAHAPTGPAPPGRRTAAPGKLTWSQRQEKARQEREAEEAPAESAPSVDHVVSQMNRASVNEEPPAPSAPPAPPAPPAPSVPEPTASAEPPALDAPASGGQRATVLYDYDAQEDNELTLREGEILTAIDQVDEGWWSATGPSGATGLFPANYVELLEEAEPEAETTSAPPPPPAPPAPPAPEPPAVEQIPHPPPPPPTPPAPPAPEPPAVEQVPPPPPPPPAPPAPPAPEPPTEEQVPPPPPPPPAPPAPPAPEPEAVAPPPPPPPAPPAAAPQAVALYDYEMDEDNEITLAEGDQIVDIEFASEDWWSGTNARTGAMGLFPANYVERLS